MRRPILVSTLIVGLALLGFAIYYAGGVIALGAGYSAKVMCSAVFVSKRDPASVRTEDLSGLLAIIDTRVDSADGAVEASFLGLGKQRAIHRPGLGCTRISDPALEPQLREQGERYARRHMPRLKYAEPLSRAGADQLSAQARQRLDAVIDRAFGEPIESGPIRTRAVVVIHRGRILAERYATGIDAQTPLVGWSMTKSIINALIGVLVGEGRLTVDSPAPIEEWQTPGDPRRAITVGTLLRMTSGIEFSERTGPVLSDVNRMLFLAPDVVAFAAARPLAHPSGTRWAYTSAGSNLLSGVIRATLGGDVIDYWAFPREALFDRIGMDSAIIEPDAAGNLVGSSFSYATARDWARFGLLYLNDGIWNGEQVLPRGWVEYTTQPTAVAPELRYGASWWLIWPDPDSPSGEHPIAYAARGYEGQNLVVVPSEELVIVRLGQTPPSGRWEIRPFVESIIEALSLDEPEASS